MLGYRVCALFRVQPIVLETRLWPSYSTRSSNVEVCVFRTSYTVIYRRHVHRPQSERNVINVTLCPRTCSPSDVYKKNPLRATLCSLSSPCWVSCTYARSPLSCKRRIRPAGATRPERRTFVRRQQRMIRENETQHTSSSEANITNHRLMLSSPSAFPPSLFLINPRTVLTQLLTTQQRGNGAF